MPEKLTCPSCGGHDVRPIELNGRKYFQCFSPVERTRGNNLRNQRTTLEACKYWSTKESAWQRKTSS